MKNDKKSILLYAFIVAVLTQVYFSPSSESVFVISAGVIFMEAVLLHSTREGSAPFVLLTGAMASVMRMVIHAAAGKDALQALYSTATFYLVFGALVCLFYLCRLDTARWSLKMLLIGIADALSNVAELFVLRQVGSDTLRLVLFTAFTRVLLVCLLDLFYRQQMLYIRQEEHQERYARLNQLAADIWADAFYLSKASGDLDSLVKESYQLYATLTDEQGAQTALSLSRRAHEVKKDCIRVVGGLQMLTEDIEHEHSLSLRDIFRIIEDSTVRQKDIVEKQLSVSFSCNGNCDVHTYYSVFTILNNLLSNAVDACDTGGTISVTAKENGDWVELCVSDDGCGIEEDVLPYIFGAGFSTKFDEKTGAASSGIGLCHVQNVVEVLNGTIEVQSDGGTTFTVRLPKAELEGVRNG